jgi:hypothetical protein
MGIVPVAGRGRQPSSSNRKNSPAKDTRSSRQQARITLMASSVQAPRRA